MKNIIALVTGAAGGLGRATAIRFANQGARVVVVDLPSQSDNAHDTIAAAGGPDKAIFQPCDVTSEGDITKALDAAETKFGVPVNCAVNCAGIIIGNRTLHAKKGPHDLNAFNKILNVNVAGTFNVARLAAERMAQSKPFNDAGDKGVVINTASVAAFEGQIGQVAYSASKGAITGMTMPMARDLGSFNIRVATIAPGLFLTPMMEGLPVEVQEELGKNNAYPKRLGDPLYYAQMAQSIVENPYLTGETIRLDAGIRMTPK